MQILIERLKNLRANTVLDAATGRGIFIRYLMEGLQDYKEIIGIDQMPLERLAKFCEEFKDARIKLIQMDAAKTNFEDEHFDMVCLSNSLHHLSNISEVMQELKRVLKKDGIFILNEMVCDNQSPSQMTYVMMHHWWGKIDTALGILHKETLPRQSVIDVAVEHKLRDVEILTWDDPDNPMDAESLEQISKIIDEYIERAKPLECFEAMKAEGELIRKHLYEHGVNAATQVIIIGKK